MNLTLLNEVSSRVLAEMNGDLRKPYTSAEVNKALFSIGDTKAPGMDGLHANFFKKCRNILENGRVSLALLIARRNHGHLMEASPWPSPSCRSAYRAQNSEIGIKVELTVSRPD
jgi:hypothetical protein